MKKVYTSNLFFLLLVIFELIVLCITRIFIVSFNSPIWLIIIGSQITFLVLPLIIYFRLSKEPLNKVFKLKKVSLQNVVIVIFISICIVPISHFLQGINSLYFTNDTMQTVIKVHSPSFIMLFIVIGIISAVGEELAIRGVVLYGYKNLDIKKSAIITAVFFSLFHMSKSQFLYFFVFGAILAYIVYITECIFYSIICHAVVNMLNVMIIYSYNDSTIKIQDMITSSSATKVTLNLSLFIVMLVCITLVYLLMKKLYKINKFNENTIVSTNKTISFISNKFDDTNIIRIVDYLPAAGGVCICLLYAIKII